MEVVRYNHYFHLFYEQRDQTYAIYTCEQFRCQLRRNKLSKISMRYNMMARIQIYTAWDT